MFNHHEHKLFAVPRNYQGRDWFTATSIDEAIDWLIEEHKTNETLFRTIISQGKDINVLRQELSVIHQYYRDDLCGDCCHADVCSKSESIKFGDDCEDKPLPCSLEIELEEIDEPEVSDEYREIIEEQIKLLRECNEELANFSKADNSDRICYNAREIGNLLRVLTEEKSPCANTD